MLPGLTDALTAAARGLALFPIPAGRRVPLPGWHGQCTRDPDQITDWRAGLSNIGVGCRASDVIALDLDGGGARTFADLCDTAGDAWPNTFTVATPGGGEHLYFRAAGHPYPSLSGGRAGLGDGIDTRGPGRTHGGYLLGPGSVTLGGWYQVTTNAPVLDLPDWLAARLRRTRQIMSAGRDAPPPGS